MGGLNISCGEYLADDKAGSAFERVLSELPNVDSGLKRVILSGFDDQEFTVIESEVASQLIEPLKAYRQEIEGLIGHDDWAMETAREEASGSDPLKLKWGEGRGWRMYCAVNLLRACEVSEASGEPVVVCLG